MMNKYFLLLLLTISFFSCSAKINDPSTIATKSGNLALSPVLKIYNLQGGDFIKGGSSYPVRFSVTDAIGFNSSRLEYSKNNGASWQLMISATGQNSLAFPTISGDESIFNWAVPVESACTNPILLSDSNQYLIRITSSGRPDAQASTQFSLSTFTVDSCAPKFAATQFVTGTQDKGFIQFNISGLTDSYSLSPIKAVCIKANSSSAPLASDSCWRSLKSLRINSSPTPSTITINYFAGFISSTFDFYAWSMDQAENISVSTVTEATDRLQSVIRNCIPSTKCSIAITQTLTANNSTIGSGLITKMGSPSLASVQNVIDPKLFIISANGTFIYRDAITKAIMKLNLLTDNMATVLIANAVTSVDGNQSVARVSNPARLSFDFDENLIILDNDKIRKVTFSSDTIFNVTTIAGGGLDSLSQQILNPLSLQILNFDKLTATGANQYWYGTFEVMQSGKIYFSNADPSQVLDSSFINRSQLKIFDPNAVYKINSVDFTGIGVQGSPAQTLTTAVPYSNFGLIIDLTNSAVQKITTRLCEAIGTCTNHSSVSFSADGISVGSSGHALLPSQWSNANNFNSRRGELYNANADDAKLLKYNTSTLNWDAKLGTGIYPGSFCTDSTSALSCAVRLWDAFVGYNDQIYFIDNGRLRFIDLDGKVKTITQ